jgi:hypothetical protein
MRSPHRAALALVIIVCGAMRVPRAGAACVGDCAPVDARVTINELVLGVGIALGTQPVSACASMDANANGAVSINELVMAVNAALNGCPPVASPTKTATRGSSGPTATVTPHQPTATSTATVTRTPAPGPAITFFGVLLADDSVQPPSGQTRDGIPIYQRPSGFGFSLVVEARESRPASPPLVSYTSGGPPDLQIQATRPLGDGSLAVCDNAAPHFGGVPAIAPPQIENPTAIADALNDFGCRFVDGGGAAVGRRCADGCVRFDTGEFGCQSSATVQFCGAISAPLAFRGGDTLVTVRVRGGDGQLGAPAQLIMRIGQ